MKTKNFNKLVRDRIPEIIEQSNRKVFMKILDDDEFINELVIKRNEEFRTRRGYS
jgi:predicted house-cleaning noncanonical NTP pyrophosphatase (MazG superfamily)